ncbi:MAG: hypothetical protein V7L27_14690 [Nostoc sp.]|uniref:hypothetical protein n=1 Tax=Nostoc sp. TaxID=1180 RepID=UPI002FF8CB06
MSPVETAIYRVSLTASFTVDLVMGLRSLGNAFYTQNSPSLILKQLSMPNLTRLEKIIFEI